MQIPTFLEFHGDCVTALRDAMTEVFPLEGCALLLGHKLKASKPHKNILWQKIHNALFVKLVVLLMQNGLGIVTSVVDGIRLLKKIIDQYPQKALINLTEI